MKRQAAAIVATVLLSGAAMTPAEPARPALFGPEAGFHHARFSDEPIRVADKRWMRWGVRYWNARAGWDLLVLSDDPEITARLDKKCGMCAQLPPPHDWTEPYTTCNVSIYRSYRDEATVAHEIGHCLGLRHQLAGVMDPSRPRFDAKFDARLLIEAGYR